mmetsp:Transcript_29097/g.93852  ORF Transcript_29097/g.93852 Transcript_29097/m.93852 type:complete len:138 (-) Transcript_29097:140-553(-)
MTRTVAGNRCGTPRPGRRASSRREGDWHCQSCGNINYNSRLMCNQCGIQKPEGLGEPREGRAGGFDERQTADDYKAPASADDDDDGPVLRDLRSLPFAVADSMTSDGRSPRKSSTRPTDGRRKSTTTRRASSRTTSR